ncbi:hypothetical protein EJ06DRAFT_560590 [Trichodelitschia bisporula]|uniref:Uncharacterized protein n=1 Tax=Trichodelitschia bisporula TaxID=703511 RepID=A0A6G1HII6_9PEZI|nr:hypothetical protein EJ06DRAFT_560590 [Trichodelitschia bisporula]
MNMGMLLSKQTPGGYEWRSSPPPRHSPNPSIYSPVYPDRPIRPLPKRHLRDRLSAKERENIVFPPNPPTTPPIFGYPYVPKDKPASTRRAPHTCDNCRHDDSDSDEGSDGGVVFSPDRHDARVGRTYTLPVRPSENKAAPDSAASSADGYDSFENTNNKKKRKIPQSNVGHHTTLSPEMANMGLRSTTSDEVDSGASYQSPSSTAASSAGTGVSGPARVRYGRSGRGSMDRRPLASSTNGVNGNITSPRRGARTGSAEPGIISAAIASAQTTPQKGNENVSLLSQDPKSPPQKTAFTFTCESDKPVWPGGHSQASAAYPAQTRRPQPAMQSSPSAISTAAANAVVAGAPQQQPPAQAGAQAPPPPPPDKKTRPRRPGRVYTLAARQRRLQQEYANYHHPPRREDMWICEFCEYEAIFGAPPAALIRQYEIKDRKEQKRLAEKRRLLEKAKMKGRKGKKGAGKGGGKNAPPPAAPAHTNQQRAYEAQEEAEEEEYYDDEYGDEEEEGAYAEQAPYGPGQGQATAGATGGGGGGGGGRLVGSPGGRGA